MDAPLKGQVAVVTGAGAGIGRSIACHLAEMGALVVACDLNEESARETVSFMSHGESRHLSKKLDVTCKDEVENAFAEIDQALGSLHILINNAGVSTMQTIERLSEQEWDFNFAVNAKGVFLCTQAAIPYLKRQGGGRIVNTASMAGTRGVPLLAHYAASKWAVIGFTKSAALELASAGISVNCVCPGYVKTGMQARELKWEAELRGMTPQEVEDEYIRNTPLGRLQTAEDVAKAVGFLVSPAAEFITGEALHVTGGANLV